MPPSAFLFFVKKKRRRSSMDLPQPDYDSALIPQILALRTASRYHEWIHTSGRPNRIRIFRSDTLEGLSTWTWWYIIPLWTPVIFVNVVESLRRSGFSNTLTGFTVGLLLWGLMEYVLHRFVFHHEPTTNWGNVFHFLLHGIHHMTPNDSQRLTFPPAFSVTIAFFIYFALSASHMPVFRGVFAGIVTGYLLYDVLHFTFHHGGILIRIPYFTHMKMRHLRHHYKASNTNFGVTSPLFDVLFGTNES